ncbi:FG-GAP-like repeat-containing protein [Propionibacteriaceae bacterium Y1923]|uniref:FG-GAP-like repeat-containing protein n=1 Tax=Aestuariimicrobium sp. Y1814 TaxID=3418742 RepID=UPI003C1BCE65
MRSRLGFVLVLALIAALAITPTTAHADNRTLPANPAAVVTIPDAGFKACLAAELGVPASSPINQGQLAGIVYLECSTPGTITSLTGWEYLVNTVDLYISDQNLGAVSVPASLTALEWLSLPGNAMTSLSVPSTLTGLMGLDASHNELTSFNVPATLTQLMFLQLGFNRLTSFTVPSTLSELVVLEVSVNQLTSLTIPAGATQLGALEAYDNLLTSLALPNTLTELGYVDLTWNDLTSITVPPTLTQLEYLGLGSNRLADLSTLAFLPPSVVEAPGQRLMGPDVQLGYPYAPYIRDHRGQPVTITAVAGSTVSGGMITYQAPGSYQLSFTSPNGYSGTISQKAVGAIGASGVFGDHTGDGIGDLFAIDSAGRLQFYQGSTTGAAVHVGVRGTGWGSMTYLTQLDDIDGDKRSDLLARRGNDQSLWAYRGLGGGNVTGFKQIGKNWGGMDQIVPVGNLDGGSTQYVVARRAADGKLFRYTLTQNGLTGITEIGQHWNGMKQILSVGDFNGDGRSDILAIRKDGTLWSYLGTPQGRIGAGKQVGHGWGNFTRAFTAGDLSGDRLRDLVGQRADGVVFTYPNQQGSWGPARQILTGTRTHLLMA